ncbi:DUF1802 family protein [Deinococcus sp. KSM4-11]|uniref:DUF1802 family protein n=1 Tax=Deinococcus sp. KSM4-11 TaxID=2568654 RepID=UPI0010A4C977|nr:DUF1802 family protein [Deinococcus sp. KSM4-11]THF84939.1 DUF1802 family protein [Deinococcus sp. KSM4-11]
MSITALKEWDAQCRLLTSGALSVLVRKGGIVEPQGDFEVEHTSFLLYPTFLHQNPVELRPEFKDRLQVDAHPGRVRVPALAEVVAVHKVEDESRLAGVAGMQALTIEALNRRFAYRGKPWVHVLVLRVRPLVEPLVLPETEAMLGCVSWVPLGDLELHAGDSVLPEAELQARAAAVAQVVGA